MAKARELEGMVTGPKSGSALFRDLAGRGKRLATAVVVAWVVAVAVQVAAVASKQTCVAGRYGLRADSALRGLA